jgi:hypothetical protein
MKIDKIYPKASHKDGIFIEVDNGEIYLLSNSLLAEMRAKLKDVSLANITIDQNPLALSIPEIEKAKIISTYNYQQYEISDEDLKAACVLRG